MDGRVGAASFEWMEEYNGQLHSPVRAKRKARSRKKEFVGWGSRPLVEFLKSIGKNTNEHISQYDVTAIINEYVNKNNLIHPSKKKRIACDERLHSIFGRKTISRIKIYDMLEVHFAENQEESDDDLLYSSDDKEENFFDTYERDNVSNSEKKTYHKKKVLETPKSCFAAIIAGNIKLLYLKKSLVEDLVKDPETFESKLVGSFVRIKSDPNDFLQKNSHQLVQVTGLKKASGTSDTSTEILLQVFSVVKDIRICMLSDDNFSEEECNDLRQRVKDGLLKRPTVVELQQKAQILHEDITKHWLAKEIPLLQNLIDRANEKGWRRELDQYLEKKQLLETPDEQSRLLREVPKVIADEVELEATAQDLPDNFEQGNDASPRSILGGSSEIPIGLVVANGTASTWTAHTTDSAEAIPLRPQIDPAKKLKKTKALTKPKPSRKRRVKGSSEAPKSLPRKKSLARQSCKEADSRSFLISLGHHTKTEPQISTRNAPQVDKSSACPSLNDPMIDPIVKEETIKNIEVEEVRDSKIKKQENTADKNDNSSNSSSSNDKSDSAQVDKILTDVQVTKLVNEQSTTQASTPLINPNPPTPTTSASLAKSTQTKSASGSGRFSRALANMRAKLSGKAPSNSSAPNNSKKVKVAKALLSNLPSLSLDASMETGMLERINFAVDTLLADPSVTVETIANLQCLKEKIDVIATKLKKVTDLEQEIGIVAGESEKASKKVKALTAELESNTEVKKYDQEIEAEQKHIANLEKTLQKACKKLAAVSTKKDKVMTEHRKNLEVLEKAQEELKTNQCKEKALLGKLDEACLKYDEADDMFNRLHLNFD